MENCLVLEIFSEDEQYFNLPLYSAIVYFVLLYCRIQSLPIKLIVTKPESIKTYCIKISKETFQNLTGLFQKTEYDTQTLKDCHFPAVIIPSESTCIGGLCAALRWAIKSKFEECQHGDHDYIKDILGFRNSCLVSCSEVSLWTKFCEIGIVNAAEHLCSSLDSVDELDEANLTLPNDLLLLESHLLEPVRTHNIRKRLQDTIKQLKKLNISTERSAREQLPSVQNGLEHIYVEGIDMTLADLIIFPCVHLMLSKLHHVTDVSTAIPLTVKWHARLIQNENVTRALNLLNLFFLHHDRHPSKFITLGSVELPKDCLYINHADKTKPRVRHKNPQTIIDKLNGHQIEATIIPTPCSIELPLPWDSYPVMVHPLGGDLPPDRVVRKCQQIENLVVLVLRLAFDGCTIVDFCSGGGHVGMVLAYLLPKCKVIMIENKESSMARAKDRSSKLGLNNVYFYQCNLDYFKGSFDIGLSLHACGVATDLVIQKCILQNAAFVCCPCCYGSIQSNHHVQYPQSKTFAQTQISYSEYILLCHYADRTEISTPTCAQGRYCMGLVDQDRVLHAKESGYSASVTIMKPENCSPKSHVVIGIPPQFNGNSNNLL